MYGHQRDVALFNQVDDVVCVWRPPWMPTVRMVSVTYCPASSRVSNNGWYFDVFLWVAVVGHGLGRT